MKKMYTLKQVHETYGISVSMLKKLIRNGELVAVKVGAKNFVEEAEIDGFIEKNRTGVKNV